MKTVNQWGQKAAIPFSHCLFVFLFACLLACFSLFVFCFVGGGANRYGQVKSQVLQEFNDMQDYVLQKVFGYPAEQDPATGRLKVNVPPDRGSRALLRPNDFPYYLERLPRTQTSK